MRVFICLSIFNVQLHSWTTCRPTYFSQTNCLKASQGRSQHGAKGQLPPTPDFSLAPAPSSRRVCPDHGCSLAMGQLPLMITNMPILLTSQIMQISQFVQQQIYSIKQVCTSICTSTVVDLVYCIIYLLTSRGVACMGWDTSDTCLLKIQKGHRHLGPAKCFDT